MSLYIVESRYEGFDFQPRLAFPGIAGVWRSKRAAIKGAVEMMYALDHYCPGVGTATQYRVVEYAPMKEHARFTEGEGPSDPDPNIQHMSEKDQKEWLVGTRLDGG